MADWRKRSMDRRTANKT